jgi:hypothetical protein
VCFAYGLKGDAFRGNSFKGAGFAKRMQFDGIRMRRKAHNDIPMPVFVRSRIAQSL